MWSIFLKNKNKVFISKTGVISCLGNDPQTMADRLSAGDVGIKKVLNLSENSSVSCQTPLPFHIAGTTDFDVKSNEKLTSPKLVPVFRNLLEQIKPSEKIEIDAILLSFKSSSYEGFENIFAEDEVSVKSFANSHLTKSFFFDELEKNNFNLKDKKNIVHFGTTCASGLVGVGIAFERIRHSNWKRALVCCIDMVELYDILLLNHLGAVTESTEITGSMPFDKKRSGLVRSGGAAICLVESEFSSFDQLRFPAVEIGGFGQTSDAWRLTDGREDGAMVAEAIREALNDAQISKNDISYIKTHGTSTYLNDQLEARALNTVFGESLIDIPVSSIKSQIGHCTDASGLVELVACIEMIRRQEIFPMTTVSEVDPEFSLNLVLQKKRQCKIENVLCTAIGFGGYNASLILKGITN